MRCAQAPGCVDGAYPAGRVWDYRELEQLNRFSNLNPRGSRVTGCHVVNDLHVSMLLVSSGAHVCLS